MQTFHFYDRDTRGDEIHSVVGADQLPNGRYKAWMIEGPGADIDVRGYGPTILSAIANLNEVLEANDVG
jgi:hypothetical protein